MVDRVERDIRRGKNVVILMPEHSPDGLDDAINKRIRATDSWPWYVLDCRSDNGLSPAHFLVQRFLSSPDIEALWNTRYLIMQEGFRGQLIWLETFTEDTWASWRDFLSEYSHACRSLQAHERTLFVAYVKGACLSVYKWDGWIEQTDMWLYASQRLRRNGLTRVQYQTALAAIARLALWDPEAADALASEELSSILQPKGVLSQLAKERGWNTLSEREHTWYRGAVALIEDRPCKHSALLALNDPVNELESRIWSAQVGVILPYVEEHRRELLRRLQGQLRVPWRGSFGEITDIRDLEIGHIEAQILKYSLPVDRSTLRLISQLRIIRNKLAHLEPLRSDLLSI